MAERVSELALLVRAGTHLFAIAASRVGRIVLADEIEAAVRRPDGSGRVQIGGRWYGTCGLGELFGVRAPSGALVLIELEADLSIALQVGACLQVATTPPLTEVPPGLIRGRGAGIVGAFASAGVGATHAIAPFGLMIDPAGLLTADERAALRRELRDAVVDEWSEP